MLVPLLCSPSRGCTTLLAKGNSRNSYLIFFLVQRPPISLYVTRLITTLVTCTEEDLLSKEVIYRRSPQLLRAEATFEIVITGERKEREREREREREEDSKVRDRRELKRSRFDAVDNAQLATRN